MLERTVHPTPRPLEQLGRPEKIGKSTGKQEDIPATVRERVQFLLVQLKLLQEQIDDALFKKEDYRGREM